MRINGWLLFNLITLYNLKSKERNKSSEMCHNVYTLKCSLFGGGFSFFVLFCFCIGLWPWLVWNLTYFSLQASVQSYKEKSGYNTSDHITALKQSNLFTVVMFFVKNALLLMLPQKYWMLCIQIPLLDIFQEDFITPLLCLFLLDLTSFFLNTLCERV